MTAYDLHPLCTLFPRVTGAEFDAMREDIRANGLREPIVTHDGMILDGGNRYRACMEAGVEPEFKEFDGADVVGFVLSANLHRRHLTAGQHAAIVASVTNWAQAQAHGGDRRSDQAATLPLESVRDRAAASGASERTQRMADKVAKASPALAKKVAHGEVTLPEAVRAVSPPKEPAQAEQPAAAGSNEPQAGKPDDAPPEGDAYEMSEEEIQAALAEDAADRVLWQSIADSDDRIATAVAEVKKLRERVRILEELLRGAENTRNEAIATVKSRDRQIAKLQKQLKAAGVAA